MLQFVAILTTGGLLLFSTIKETYQALFQALVDRIIDSRNLQQDFEWDSLRINYVYDPVLKLIFVISWRKEIVLDYPHKLLQALSLEWKHISQKITWKQSVIVDAPDFQECYQRAYDKWVAYVNQKEEKGKEMVEFGKTQIGKKVQKKKKKKEAEDQKTKDTDDSKDKHEESEEVKQELQQIDPQMAKLSPRERLLMAQRQRNKNKSPKQSPKHSPQKSDTSDDKNSKSSRIWQGGKINKKDLESLDLSKKRDPEKQKLVSSKMYMEQEPKQIEGFIDSDEEVQEQKESKFLSKWVGKLKDVVGDKKITKQDLKEVLKDFKQKLMEKNVAHDVADKVSEAVGATLLETKTKSFTTVHKTVREAMKDALRKILTPKKKIDLVTQVTKQRQKMKPYVIVFIGVNGVGKSTNLAKVAYMLKQAKLSVMLAACDNFRAGAVEQIMTHGRNLDIPVYQKGYKQQPANIAFQAIRDATRKRIDAVLVDTAGRMQDNAPLMKQLGRLVKINKPNLVCFIGEALVGNDAVDQITKFNNALKEESTEVHKSQIDAILLSKFDTVDDKVGAALSLVYSTSKPILYVGVGQKYPNLKQLNTSTVVQALLS